ncbi:MAG: aldehyde ferredoxin oxidoreductase family protein [Dehalococcoidia bacterium]|nr:aldehyde ferredoxin oxidoreductase family protein [Dehalococcoidia bacterium]
MINLSNREITQREIHAQDYFEYIGAAGMNTRILLDEMDPSIDPLSEGNVLCFGSGPLVGTMAPTANRTDASAKSPLTGLLGMSNSGYSWGPELKFCGYDHLVIKGKSETPVYISVNNGKVNILSANHIWGKNSWDTIRTLKDELGDKEISVACIGVGGERLVKFASIENGFYGAWGRTGLGAVMGSKNLKAIALRGHRDVTVADSLGFQKSVDEMRTRILNHPTYNPWRQFGSMLAVDIYCTLGAATGYNQNEAIDESFIHTMGRENLLRYKKKSIGCTACPLACASWVEIDEGPYKGLKLKGIEITPTMDFGARCGVRNLAAIAKATEIFQKYGVDCSTAAASIALAIELFQKGIITEADSDGLELKWGDELLIFELLRKITYREGFGDLLADGPVEMAKKIGKDSEQYLPQIRGLETSTRDPRSRWDVWSFGYLINARGGDHLRIQSPAENLRQSAPEGEYFHELSPPEKAVAKMDIFDDWKQRIFDFEKNVVNIPYMAAWSQDMMNVVNSIGTCIRPPILYSLGPTIYSEVLTALTGIEFLPEDIRKAGERITNIQRIFNFKAGEKREDIKYGPKFYNMPIKGRKLDKDKIDKVLDKYFQVRNWDPKTSLPKEEKLRELNLDKPAWSRFS